MTYMRNVIDFDYKPVKVTFKLLFIKSVAWWDKIRYDFIHSNINAYKHTYIVKLLHKKVPHSKLKLTFIKTN